MSSQIPPTPPANSQTSPRLRLWQVLRDEYHLFHPDAARLVFDPAFWSLKTQELKFPQLALRLREQTNKVAMLCFRELDETSRNELRRLDGTQPLTPKLREDILNGLNKVMEEDDFYDNYDETTVGYILSEAETEIEYESLRGNPLPADKLPQVNRWLLEETFPDEIVSIDESLTAKYYSAIHEKNHAALCLSGGGIRSGTFNLGLLQGLARHGLLEGFEYLSTVSGGGFSGGWLTAWIKRHQEGLDGVVKDLGKQDRKATPRVQRPLEPEPEALGWLRSYSNFLNPKLGLFSADTWTLVATVLRNIFLNWLVFVPVIMAALVLPRLWVAFLSRETFADGLSFSLISAFTAGMLALLYIGYNLPSTRQRNRGQGDFLLFCLAPLIISSMSLATYWWRATDHHLQHNFWGFALYQVLIISGPWAACALFQLPARRANTTRAILILNYLIATLLIFISQIITALLMWKAAAFWQGSILLYTCFAVPVILALLAFTGVLLAGLTSRYTDDEEQEWWARAGAWVFITIIGWSVLFLLVIYGPQLLMALPRKISEANFFSTEVLTALSGVIAGVVALYGGFSSKVPATDQEAKKSGFAGKLVQLLVSVASLVFMAFLIIVLVILTNALLVMLLNGILYLFGTASTFTIWLTSGIAFLPAPAEHLELVRQSPARLLLILAALLFGLGYLCDRLINTNKFSLHYLWRNRIIRAYLGASNDNRRPNRFTGFDKRDNLRMHDLKPERKKKLVHVLNFALNLVGGEKLAWQERKAESFTVSPLHCGNHNLGYRLSGAYGGKLKPGNRPGERGISLGTSVAISGAFVSPNMGYMQSSPVIRFLMTLFNVRFGWWLGNPGRAGGGSSDSLRTYDLDSPRWTAKLIVKEALGMTNDKSDYVYLSDGGHFENLGLYEMVLRRCHLIVVGDATSDAEYSFESLGQSIRKIRIDLGIPIEFERFLITKPNREGKGVYAAIGRIRYSCIDTQANAASGGQTGPSGNKDTGSASVSGATTPDKTATSAQASRIAFDPYIPAPVKTESSRASALDGTMILIKPTLIGNEDRDVLNYASQSGSFPQEFIGDQWFSESQFESYRALGSHIVDALCRKPGQDISDSEIIGLAEFQKRVAENLDSNSETDFGEKVLNYLKKNIP